MGKVTHIGTQIANNTSLSGEIDLGEFNLLAIEIPTTWPAGVTTIAFQSKSVRANDEGVNPSQEVWRTVLDDTGAEITCTVAQNRIIAIGTVTKAALGALRYLRIRTGTNAAPVNVSPLQELRIIAKANS